MIVFPVLQRVIPINFYTRSIFVLFWKGAGQPEQATVIHAKGFPPGTAVHTQSYTTFIYGQIFFLIWKGAGQPEQGAAVVVHAKGSYQYTGTAYTELYIHNF
jgi:hypothetical protein